MELDFKALAAGLLTAAVFAFAAHARDSRLSPDELTKPESCKATQTEDHTDASRRQNSREPRCKAPI